MKITGVLIGFLLFLPAFAWAGSEGYGYPIDESYAATILGTPQNLRPDTRGEVPVKTMVLETDLEKPELFFYDRGLRYRESFRYFDSDYPFEYYMVRYLFSQERELKILR